MSEDTLSIQIYFNDSTAISPSILNLDILKVHILQNDLFITKMKARTLSSSDAFMSMTIEP